MMRFLRLLPNLGTGASVRSTYNMRDWSSRASTIFWSRRGEMLAVAVSCCSTTALVIGRSRLKPFACWSPKWRRKTMRS